MNHDKNMKLLGTNMTNFGVFINWRYAVIEIRNFDATGEKSNKQGEWENQFGGFGGQSPGNFFQLYTFYIQFEANSYHFKRLRKRPFLHL